MLIKTLPHFLHASECDLLIAFSEQLGYDEATVSLPEGAKMLKNIRNNDRLRYTDTALATRLWEKLRPEVPALLDNAQAVGLNECFRFYRYDPGQRFKRHIDGRFRRNEHEESRLTFMIYLNDDYSGGQTRFDTETIQPRQGDALIFTHELKHESVPIEQGTKYVLRSEVMYRHL